MKQNPPNSWHKSMYNKDFANESIGSERFIKLAKSQTSFLIKVTSLKSGQSVLDVPCGVGRHAIEFAKFGAKVTGVDISKDCLMIAKSKFSHRNINYIHGDMLKLSRFKGRFDLVVNLFTSFGYFATDKENFLVLKELAKCLRPGGKLVINLIDKDWILPIYQPVRWYEHNGLMVMEASRYDSKTNYNESQMVMIDKKSPKPKLKHYHYHRVRIYSKNEMVGLMREVGLKNIKIYGDFEGTPFKKGKSTHPIYIATK